MNIKFCYQYRDGANYKQCNEIIFANPTQKKIEEINKLIRNNLIDGDWFVAKHWGIPDMHFREFAWDSEIDHEWHEFNSIEQTEQTATEKISIADFLAQIENK